MIMPPTLGNIAFQALSLGVLGVFCWMIHAFRAQAVECLRSVVAFSGHKGGGVENRRLYERFLNFAMTLGTLSAGLLAVKVAAAALTAGTGTPGTWQWHIAGLAGTNGLAGMPVWVAPAAVFAVAAVVVVVVLAGMGVLKAAGSLTLSGKFTDAIVQTKRSWLAAASMLFVPLAAVWTGMNPVRDATVTYFIAFAMIALFLLFVAQTLNGFLKQKVSLLIWFLYLCTVEIFPISLVVLLVVKNV